MQSNGARPSHTLRTHEGASAPRITPYAQLRRSVLSCLLWEDEFYENGQSIADRITETAASVDTLNLAALAIEARSTFHLRHAPLLLAAALAKSARGNCIVAETIEQVIQRADELAEFLSIYWRNGKTPIAKQVKKGLAAAFRKFDGYQLAKYNREKAITLRDVLFLVHAKPKDDAQAALWKQLVDDTLPAPDTWEVGLSGGGDKRETFTRLLREGKLGYLALLRNLRNMAEAGVDRDLIIAALTARKGAHNVLPFRYVAAARACPQFEPQIDFALRAAIHELPPLKGMTVVLQDVSGSMDDKLSAKSDLTRMDAGCALAAIVNAEQLRTFTFSTDVIEVPARRGMAGIDAMKSSQQHGGTRLIEAIKYINGFVPHDRLIVVTDEQTEGNGYIRAPKAKHAYMVNVASAKNGVGYGSRWTHIDGFSEGVLRYIVEAEREADR